jgi:predicted NAD/FAD-binding protein
MARIAVIGTGIAGLSAAWLLDRRHDIAVYEKEARIGGHTRTLNIRHGDRTIPVDTGFIVYNERNYPNLTALLRHLGVRTHKSDMSFALSVRDGWLEWGARNANSIFGQRRNIIRPSFLNMFREVMRFNASAVAMLADHPGLTLGEFIARLGMSDEFCQHYILPMAGAIWSCPPRQMLAFPAETFVRFFANHGLLSYTGQPQWYTVSGGAQTYVDRLTSSFAPRIRTSCRSRHKNARRRAGARCTWRRGAFRPCRAGLAFRPDASDAGGRMPVRARRALRDRIPAQSRRASQQSAIHATAPAVLGKLELSFRRIGRGCADLGHILDEPSSGDRRALPTLRDTQSDARGRRGGHFRRT